jgi:23S rRNA (guanine745-N1)-methyltransferase
VADRLTVADGDHRKDVALDRVVEYLGCPLCGLPLGLVDGQLRCEARHSYNIARQGYASLLSGGKHPSAGDSAEMVEARAAFLATGHYSAIADAVSAAIPGAATDEAAIPGASLLDETGGLCLDLAGGTGYYLGRVMDAHPRLVGLSLDLSPHAARRAAMVHPRVASATADAWQRLPLLDRSVRHALSIFGPRNPDELARVLTEDGRLVVVTPTGDHLRELRDGLDLIGIDERKEDRLRTQLERFEAVGVDRLDYRVAMTREDVLRDVTMGPNAYHVDAEQLRLGIERLGETTQVTVSVTIGRYRLLG